MTDMPSERDRPTALVVELQHRTRNLMTVIQSLANETARKCGTIEEFSRRFSARLACLARAQGLLSKLDAGEEASLADLVEGELAALGAGGDRIAVEGPPGLRLRSGALQPLALALHELADNAVRHGALSGPDGRLAVHWRYGPEADDGRGSLRIEWAEIGVRTPESKAAPIGLGRELIEEALAYQAGANVEYKLTRDGVRCVIVLPTYGEPT